MIRYVFKLIVRASPQGEKPDDAARAVINLVTDTLVAGGFTPTASDLLDFKLELIATEGWGRE